jgi:hypothetical protein
MGEAQVIEGLRVQALGDEPEVLYDGIGKVFGFFEAFGFAVAGFEVLGELAEVELQYGQLGAYFVMEVFGNAFAFLFLALEHRYEAFALELEVFVAQGEFMLDNLFLLKYYQHYNEYAQHEHCHSAYYHYFNNIHDRLFFAFTRPI